MRRAGGHGPFRSLEARIGWRFESLPLLEQALTHKSRAHEALDEAARHNEPLEFLGDSVLGFLVADLLHRRSPEGDEGTKSLARARLVSTPNLARHAARLGLPGLLRLGKGEEKTGGREKPALWAGAYEALVAALYLDGGIEAVRRFVEAEFGEESAGDLSAKDSKTTLQEMLQSRGQPPPEYRVAAEEGPSHRPRFRVRCLVAGDVVGEGEGPSKKTAQQDAARRALERLKAPR
jgi:ribonuclease-3